MKLQISLYVFLAIWQCVVAPPVSKTKEDEAKENSNDGLEDYMEYHRYLKEVVNALESDPEFRQKLEKADEADIRSGKIAHQLEFVSHQVRTRLDEIKRLELDRLRELTEQKQHLQNNDIAEDPRHTNGHLDHENPHTFEIEDLKKLIEKTTYDLAEADRKRREEFKQYELQKELEKQDKLNHTNGDEREKLKKEYKEQEDKHKKHDPLHEPGHKAQLEEVWEEQDHMQQEFEPKTFFMLHDLDSNGLWDQDEVKALFVKELDKMYAAGAPEDDMRERVEEMERMRETVFREVDTNKDGFIDFNEFVAQTKRQDFEKDNGWQGLDEQKPYTDEELQEYIRQQQLHNSYQQGYDPNQGYYGQAPPGAYHPNEAPQLGHHPQGGYHVPPGGYHTNQVPPGGYHPNQVPSGGYHQNQVPPGGYHQNQAQPGGYHQNQIPPGGYHPNQGQQGPPPSGYQQQNQGAQVPPNGYQQQVHQGGQQPNQGAQGQPPPPAAQVAQPSNPALNTNEVYPNQQAQGAQGQAAIQPSHNPPNPPQNVAQNNEPNIAQNNPNIGQINQANQAQSNPNVGQQPNLPKQAEPQVVNVK